MLEIKKLGKDDKKIVDDVVRIHMDTFEGFFLTFMGRGFLRQMYLSYGEHEPSSLIVALEEGQTLGFLSYSSDLSGLYKHMLKTRLIPFAWYAAGAFFRKPKVFMRLIRAFLKPSESKREESYMILTSLGIDPAVKARGIATALVDRAKEDFDPEKHAYISLETDAEENEIANRFHKKQGFVCEHVYETPEGRKMIEYRWRPQE